VIAKNYATRVGFKEIENQSARIGFLGLLGESTLRKILGLLLEISNSSADGFIKGVGSTNDVLYRLSFSELTSVPLAYQWSTIEAQKSHMVLD